MSELMWESKEHENAPSAPLGVFVDRKSLGPPLEEQLLDAQMHVGRLQNELALTKKGVASELRWTTMQPAMSGVYLNTTEGERMSDPVRWAIVHVRAEGVWILGGGVDIGPYWAGPIEIGGPE